MGRNAVRNRFQWKENSCVHRGTFSSDHVRDAGVELNVGIADIFGQPLEARTGNTKHLLEFSTVEKRFRTDVISPDTALGLLRTELPPFAAREMAMFNNCRAPGSGCGLCQFIIGNGGDKTEDFKHVPVFFILAFLCLLLAKD